MRKEPMARWQQGPQSLPELEHQLMSLASGRRQLATSSRFRLGRTENTLRRFFSPNNKTQFSTALA
jgi:hypothetical protein